MRTCWNVLLSALDWPVKWKWLRSCLWGASGASVELSHKHCIAAGRHRTEDLCIVVIKCLQSVFLRAQRVTVGSRVYLGWTWVDEPCKKVLVG